MAFVDMLALNFRRLLDVADQVLWAEETRYTRKGIQFVYVMVHEQQLPHMLQIHIRDCFGGGIYFHVTYNTLLKSSVSGGSNEAITMFKIRPVPEENRPLVNVCLCFSSWTRGSSNFFNTGFEQISSRGSGQSNYFVFRKIQRRI